MRVLLILAFFAISLAVGGNRRGPSSADSMAKAFLDSLGSNATQATFDLASDERKNWNYVPIARKGVSLAKLDKGQLERATALLRASLSDAGFRKVEQIRALEDVLYEMENKNPGRDKLDYHFLFFGEPKGIGSWAWRYEGHHISLSFAYHDDRLVSSTPQFLGTNPAEVKEGPHKGRPLAKEQDLAFKLLDSLSEAQRAKAVVGEKAPADIVTANQRKIGILNREGIGYPDLKPAQRSLLIELILAHAEVQAPAEQKRRMERVDRDTVVFAWMGSTKPGVGHYYRVQGSKFLIEYDNTQNDANHIHAVWRDFDGDFGEDVLREHYEHSHHH